MLRCNAGMILTRLEIDMPVRIRVLRVVIRSNYLPDPTQSEKKQSLGIVSREKQKKNQKKNQVPDPIPWLLVRKILEIEEISPKHSWPACCGLLCTQTRMGCRLDGSFWTDGKTVSQWCPCFCFCCCVLYVYAATEIRDR